ncbi:hypothetical protein BOTBODRAFT_37425 [Botryobasidium botryosum FD-172 SS1]|uniref:C3H1-type domain-containing protein n=1 Tax=Botryobasidium botryosum (strain FD-172 SS1) TaxID=930990 RepID=A0A067M0H3_BOTB1|nr:hypothetical protein BOTBODRAFT_37425 [Botryobasidium botryosum FD-172 SS1]
MPQSNDKDSLPPSDAGHDPREKEKNGAKSGKGASKSKDLSHVPCKFFRVGACTAGPACPFSHIASEPGQQKQVCNWFVKGSCKFGHKCALAHILPGQPISMDRKNKRAAQQAAGGGQMSGKNDRSSRHTKNSFPAGGQPIHDPSENGKSGASPPGLKSSRAPISISKALPTISAPVVAQPLGDTDFSFGVADERQQTAPVPANPSQSSAPSPAPPPTNPASPDPIRKPSPLPFSQPSEKRAVRSPAPAEFGFGPVGSPPRASHISAGISSASATRGRNGFSPGTSPASHKFDAGAPGGFSSSPFSAPGSKSLFMSYGVEREPAKNYIGGHPASVGDRPGLRNMLAMWDPMARRGSLSQTALAEDAAGDEDLEEFLPSSLNELLSPIERERRMSRTNGQRPTIDSRFSHSVPAPSMLENVKALWDDPAKRGTETATNAPSIGAEWPQHIEGPSPSMLNPSNASAAFLPSILRPGHPAAGHGPAKPYEKTGFAAPGDSLLSSQLGQMPAHQKAPPSSFYGLHAPRPGNPTVNEHSALSPSARALRAHEPGQSLPQGLAAGLSRLHLIPAASPAAYPSTSMEWSGMAGSLQRPTALEPISASTDAAVARVISPGHTGFNLLSSTPPSSVSMTQSSLKRSWLAAPLSSPLAKPVHTNDDDDDGLFAMDEEEAK